jgi:hypothetical protein
VYHTLAQNCVSMRSSNSISLIAVGSGKKITTNVATRQDRYIIEVCLRFSSNMFLENEPSGRHDVRVKAKQSTMCEP